jgi:hypothetical protein
MLADMDESLDRYALLHILDTAATGVELIVKPLREAMELADDSEWRDFLADHPELGDD